MANKIMNNQNQNIDTNETTFTLRGRRDDQRRLRSTVAEFVDFQNPFFCCHSKLDLCGRFVLKHLVWP